jgi:hypothetical protein
VVTIGFDESLQLTNDEAQLSPALAGGHATRLVPLPHHRAAGHDVGPLFNSGLHGFELVMGGDNVRCGSSTKVKP